MIIPYALPKTNAAVDNKPWDLSGYIPLQRQYKAVKLLGGWLGVRPTKFELLGGLDGRHETLLLHGFQAFLHHQMLFLYTDKVVAHVKIQPNLHL